MKKVININFQGCVIPIEETAHEALQQYIERLRRYFAGEEGAAEIINDIEGRMAELCSALLNKGNTCITDADVQQIMAGMGQPEDFEAAGSTNTASASSYSNNRTADAPKPAKFYRNADDRIIAGIASGLANYIGIDPVGMRILFVLLFGALFWVYILLWIIVPSQSLQTKRTKRLYRSAAQKWIGGVCGGLAAYFNIEAWIPRLIFALPVLLSLLNSPFHFLGEIHLWPSFITGSLSGTLFLTYIVLWIAVPVATTTAQKLEMTGERIDLHSIRDRVKEDLETMKGKAKAWGKEIRASADQLKDRAREVGQSAGTTATSTRRVRKGIRHFISLLVKMVVLLIAGSMAFVISILLIVCLFTGYMVFPFSHFVLEGLGQVVLAWGFLLFFLCVPLVAILTWLIRRIMGVRTKRHYLGYVFGLLFLLGIVSTFLLIGSLAGNFRYKSGTEEVVPLANPSMHKLSVTGDSMRRDAHIRSWQWEDRTDWPLDNIVHDSLLLTTVRLDIIKSTDDRFALTKIYTSRGRTPQAASALARGVHYPVVSADSTLVLPHGFYINKEEKFRNQQVRLVLQVPVGKCIQFDQRLPRFSFFSIHVNYGIQIDTDDASDREHWEADTEYTMTANEGLVPTTLLDKDALQKGIFRKDSAKLPEGRTSGSLHRKPYVLIPRQRVGGQEEEGIQRSNGNACKPALVAPPDPSIHILSRLFDLRWAS